jgi:hypothetical protein
LRRVVICNYASWKTKSNCVVEELLEQPFLCTDFVPNFNRQTNSFYPKYCQKSKKLRNFSDSKLKNSIPVCAVVSNSHHCTVGVAFNRKKSSYNKLYQRPYFFLRVEKGMSCQSCEMKNKFAEI